jgi:two-component system, cell cycle response regulator
VKILVVDDNRDNVKMVSDMITIIGHQPIAASNGYEALDILAQQHIPFAIVDWMMPEMDGIELIHRIRAQFSERYIYIIMLTARDSGDDIATGLEIGADDYVSKPFPVREMRARINSGIRLIGVQERLLDSGEQMENLVSRDHLTKLYNRRRFSELATDALETHPTASLFMLDLDHFNRVNDMYGHPAGDKVLQHVASICTEEVDKEGILGRYGGEEFIGLLPGFTKAQAMVLTEGLRHAIAANPVQLPVERLAVSASLGVATLQANSGESLLDLVQRADAALYRAKREGRNRVYHAEANPSSNETLPPG